MNLLTTLLIAFLIVEIFQHIRWKMHFSTLVFYMYKKKYDVPSKDELVECRKEFREMFKK